MKIKDFKNMYQWPSFKDAFGGMNFEPTPIDIKTKTLNRNMTDEEILSEFKPEEMTLGEFATALKKFDKNKWYICYIRGKDGVLRAVGAGFHGGGWDVGAFSVEGPYEWDAGSQVVSRRFSDSKPLTLSSSDTLTQAIKTVKEAGYKVIKEI